MSGVFQSLRVGVGVRSGTNTRAGTKTRSMVSLPSRASGVQRCMWHPLAVVVIPWVTQGLCISCLSRRLQNLQEVIKPGKRIYLIKRRQGKNAGSGTYQIQAEAEAFPELKMVRVRKILFRDRQIEEKLDHNPSIQHRYKNLSQTERYVRVEKWHLRAHYCLQEIFKRCTKQFQKLKMNIKGKTSGNTSSFWLSQS